MRVALAITLTFLTRFAWAQAAKPPVAEVVPVEEADVVPEAPQTEPQKPTAPVPAASSNKTKPAGTSPATAHIVPILAEQQSAFIAFQSTENTSKDPALAKNWKEFCDRLGRGLTINALTPGFLASYSCLPLGVVDQPSKAPPWRIRIIEQKRFFEVEVSYFHKPEGYLKVRSYNFRFEGSLLSNLKGEVLPVTVARMLAEGLPVGWSYLHDASKKEIEFKVGKDQPKLPKKILVYDLSYDSKRKIWIPAVRALLTQKSFKIADKNSRTETFEISQEYLPLKDKQRYWLQNGEGLSKQQADYEKAMGSQMKGLSLMSFLDRLIFDSFESNYAGFRYGKSFLIGESIVTEADLMTFLVEMRSGLFSGLRWYYDLSPEKRRGVDGEAEFFSMSRASLGWAFDFEMPAPISLLVSRVEVQPKFGLLDVKTKFSVVDEEGQGTSLNFDAKNVYDLAIELGIEKESYWFRSRLWTSFSAAMFGVSNPSKTSVISSKAGLDAYWDFIEWGNSWDINILTFALGERLTLGQEATFLGEEEQLGISEVSFNLFFVGGGFTLSW